MRVEAGSLGECFLFHLEWNSILKKCTNTTAFGVLFHCSLTKCFKKGSNLYENCFNFSVGWIPDMTSGEFGFSDELN